jgi:hypothetical protein
MNLIEGNHGSKFQSDLVHGNSGYITLFRNWGTGSRTTPANSDASRVAFVISAYNVYHNLVGNVAGKATWTSGIALDSNTGTTLPKGFSFGRLSGGGNSTHVDSLAFSTADWGTNNSCSNYDYVTEGITGGHTCALPVPPSLYYTAKPAFFGNTPWPLFGPDVAGKVTTTPAQACFDANQMPNCPIHPPVAPGNPSIQRLRP